MESTRAYGSGLRFERHRLEPAFAEIAALRALAFAAAPAQERSVVDARLERYEWALTAHEATEANGLRAFILGQTRWIDGEQFFYLGPLYSTRGAFLPLFAYALRTVCANAGPWWLVAEIEHPRLYPLFCHLVPSSWPQPRAPIPPEAKDAARRLAQTLGHVEGLEESTLKTSCAGRPAQLVVARGRDRASATKVARDLALALASLRKPAAIRSEAVAP